MNKPCDVRSGVKLWSWLIGLIALVVVGESVAPAVPAESTWLALPKIESDPVAMTWDTRPRLWLLESIPGPDGRQGRISIVEESAGAPSTYTIKIYADNLPEPTGFEWTEQGILLGAASGLWLLRDTNRDDRVDTRQSLVTGFLGAGQGGRLSSFVRGPDSWIYFLHEGTGVAALEAKVAGVVVPRHAGCGVLRYHPGGRRLEVFSDGPLQPVSLAFDAEGNLFAATRARESLFHIVAGGNFHPLNAFPRPVQYRVPRLPAVADASLHRYGSYGFALGDGSVNGTPWVEGMMWFTNLPAQLAFRLQPDGAGFRAIAEAGTAATAAVASVAKKESFSRGPDGAWWVRSATGIARVGKPASASSHSWSSLSLLRSAELVPLLETTNAWLRSWARQRLIQESSVEDRRALARMMGENRWTQARLEALWTLSSMRLGYAEAISRSLSSPDAVMRAWGVRLLGDAKVTTPETEPALQARAKDPDPRVRREVVIAIRQLASGSIGATNDPAQLHALQTLERNFESILLASAGEADEVIKSLSAGAFDSLVAGDESGTFQVLRRVGDSGMSLSGELLNRAIQQLFGSRDAAAVNRGLEFLNQISDESPALCAAGLIGMMKGQKSSKVWTGYPGVKRLLKRLSANPNAELAGAARQVDAFCGNPAAQNAIIAKINDSRVPEAERLKAIRFTEVIPSELARAALLDVVMATNSVSLQVPAMEVFRVIGKTEDMEVLVRRWDRLSVDLRQVCSEALVAKQDWVPVLLRGMEEGRVRAAELSSQAVARLREHPNLKIRARALAALASGGR